ncbi:hypothetical protein OPQ81_010377 [Rhizoctonia solani]|nr:hypothetical protein OPQ81_010377 [Rhizoctonia solani]
MSSSSNNSCVNCRASNKRCDRMRGPTGCRRCTKAGIICGGYLGTTSRIPRPKHSNRGNELQPRTNTPAQRFEDINLDRVTSSIDGPVPSHVLQSEENSSNLPILDPERYLGYADWSLGIPASQHGNIHSRVAVLDGPLPPTPAEIKPIPPVGIPTPSIQQTPTPTAVEDRANLFDSIFSLDRDPPHTPENSELSLVCSHETALWRNSSSRSKAEPAVCRTTDLGDDETNDAEMLLVKLFDGLVLDPEAEGNIIPFVVHSFISWMSRFYFDPARIIWLCRETIVRGQSGDNALRKMTLLANVVSPVAKSTDYGLTHFWSLHTELVSNVVKVRAGGELTREKALEAMGSYHELIVVTSIVCSLASVLKLMKLPIYLSSSTPPSTFCRAL